MPEIMSSEIKAWEARWIARHDLNSTKYGEKRLIMGPIQWLNMVTRIDGRRIRGYRDAEFKFVKLSHADALWIAMGLQPDEIPIVKNPAWTWVQYNQFMRNQGLM